MSKKGRLGETYNISSGYKLRNIQIAKKIIKYLEKVNTTSKIKFVKDRLGHDRQYSINANKLRRLGWKPKRNFNDDLSSTIEWYLDKQNIKFFDKIEKHLIRKGSN